MMHKQFCLALLYQIFNCDRPTNMQKLIPLISDIQDIIRKSDVNLEISLPMIAVVGSQSTGKSSLLESIIGKQFLPKGKGIVTRRPIQIQLVQIQSDKQYAEFVDRKGEHFQSMEQFRKEIQLQTDKTCGQNKGISSIPLRVRFHSKRVLDLLLVDLPGIVKNPTGDQPKDIEQQVVKMIKGYIKNPNCIIVAVSKATDDSANSQSLKLARQVDKQGLRTIGVLTQIDLVDDSVNILRDYNTLSNQLNLGHVCVYLRPPKSTLTIQQQLKKQAEFFTNHEQYRNVAEKMGVQYLVKTMNMVLIKHIKAELPIIRENIIYMLESKKNKIAEYGQYDAIQDKKAQGILILSLVNKYVKFFIQLIEGRSMDSRDCVVGGARIQYIFSQVFIKSINKLNPFQFLNDNDIRTAIRNANGLRKSLFLPEMAFENLLRTQICRLKLPAIECAQLIHEELRRLIHSIRISEIQRFQHLNYRIFDVMERLLTKSLNKTEEMIKNLIEIELGYINTNHPDFIDVISLVKEHPENNKTKKEDALNLSFNSEHHGESDQPQVSQSIFKFNKKKAEIKKGFVDESQIMDGRLRNMNQTHDKRVEMAKKQSTQDLNPAKNYELDTFYTSFAEHNTLPRYRLPCVPTVIKVGQNAKLRQQTETEMIKRLITSYFNVVKKNINDSVPKTIVTFLVNHCKNSCEKILVNNLYVENQFDHLLEEREYISGERERIRKQILILKECLNLINGLESKISV